MGGYGPPSDPIEKPKARPKKPPPASGSEFEDQDAEGESDSGSDPPIRAKRAKRKLSDEEYYEDEADAAGEEDDDDLAEIQQNQRRRAATTSSGRNTKAGSYIESDASDEIVQAGRRHLKKHKDLKGFVAKDEDSEDFDMDAGYGEKPSRAEKNAKLENLARAKQKSHGQTYRPAPKGRQTRNSQMATVLDEDDEEWTGGDETEGAVRNLRRRKKDVNYAIQSFESIHQQDLAAAAAAQSAKAARKMISQPKLPLNMTGRQLDRYFRGKGLNDSSVRSIHHPTRHG